MTQYYTKNQMDSLAGAIGAKIKNTSMTSAESTSSWTNIFNNIFDETFELEQNDYLSGLKANYSGTGWYKAVDTNTIMNSNVPEYETKIIDGVEYISVYNKADARLHGSKAATSNLTDMSELFKDFLSFNEDISTWDTSNVTSMENMFTNSQKFNRDISNWDVKNVESFNFIFTGAYDFNQDISGWDTEKVTTMFKAFFNARSFNQDLSQWCVTSILETPVSFSEGASSWTLPKPVWGTCPRKGIS